MNDFPLKVSPRRAFASQRAASTPAHPDRARERTALGRRRRRSVRERPQTSRAHVARRRASTAPPRVVARRLDNGLLKGRGMFHRRALRRHRARAATADVRAAAVLAKHIAGHGARRGRNDGDDIRGGIPESRGTGGAVRVLRLKHRDGGG